MAENTYPANPRSKIIRYRNIASYDYPTIHNIVQSALVLHVSFVPSADDPFPTILPMLGALGSYSSPDTPLDSGPLDLYLHGSSVGRLMKLSDSSKNPDLAGDDEEGGIPLAVAATHIDGFVLALSAFHSSTNYRSAVVHGYGSLVNDPKERLYAMGLITNNVVKDRWENSRQPPLKAELTATGILKVKIVSASAKVRTGMTAEERKDLKDEGVVGSIWAGVIPCWTQRGEPVPTKENGVDKVPGHIKEWITGENEGGRRYAEGALVGEGK